MRVKDVMNKELHTCKPDTPIDELARRFADGPDYAIVVDDEGRILGMITESDLVDRERKLHLPTAIAVFDMVIPLGEKRFEEELARMRATKAEELMRLPVRTIDAEAAIEDAAEIFAEEGIHHLPVVEGDRVVGMLTPHALVRALVHRSSAS